MEPGCALALVFHTVEGRATPPSPGPPPIPHEEIKAVVKKYLGPSYQPGRYGRQGVARFEGVLVLTRFGAPRVIFAPGIPDLVRDSESLLSGYFSMSSSAPVLFGERIEDFVTEVRQLLASRSSDGVFWDWPGDTAVVLTNKPGRATG